jgi:hypothetical protein
MPENEGGCNIIVTEVELEEPGRYMFSADTSAFYSLH